MTMDDQFYMRMALQMAEQTIGQTGVNPVVGCVIVNAGAIVGMGAHLRRGAQHAEVHALQMAGEAAVGSTVYVTLEPCAHYGKTPPCAEALIRAQVNKVVIACLDPNPLVSGQGVQLLKASGIGVEVGILQEQAEALNEVFFKWIRSGRPFVTLKSASTLDGMLAASSGDSKWITGEQSREFVHTLRHQHQAIMVGVGTVITDDPSLTARGTVPLLQPVRVVVDSHLRIPFESRMFRESSAETLILTTELADAGKEQALAERGIGVLRCGAGERVDLPLALRKLGDRGISSILLEGGGTLNGAMLEAKLIDRIYLFFAPKLIGGDGSKRMCSFAGFEKMADAIVIRQQKWLTFGDDVCITGQVDYGQ